MKKVVITGGHGPSAKAVIEEIKREKSKWQIFYFGRKYTLEGSKEKSFEYQELKNDAEINFISLTSGRLQRHFSIYTLSSLLKTPLGLITSLFWLKKIKPDIIISFGGYLSVPVVIAGWMLKIPSITHEQTRSVGLANKINSHFVKKIALSFPETLKQTPFKKAILTGNPMINFSSPSQKSPLRSLISKVNKPILLVTGGKSGSRTINNVIKKIKKELKNKFFIVHQVGLDRQNILGQERGYLAVPFIKSNNFGWILNRSAMVISRSGANIVWQLAALKKRAILIPIPWSSGDEQKKNAEFLREIGLAKIIPQNKLTARVLMGAVNKFQKEKIDLHYPNWWLRVNPQKAAQKVWQLAQKVSLLNES